MSASSRMRTSRKRGSIRGSCNFNSKCFRQTIANLKVFSARPALILTQIDEVAWGATSANAQHPYEIAGVAMGQFSPNSTEARFASEKIPNIEVHGYKLWAFGSGAGANDIFFFFLDSNTAAFGQRDILQRLINVRFGGAESLLSNDNLFPLITAANANGGVVWAVL